VIDAFLAAVTEVARDGRSAGAGPQRPALKSVARR
jgi:hypothetical protein